jgi:uncharacterized protein
MASAKLDFPAFKKQASKKKKVYTKFLRGLYNRKNKKEINKWANELDKEAFKKIDCLECGNCCKTMTPTYLKSDIKRIAKHLNMSVSAYHEKYLTTEKGSKDIINKSIPCQFLQPDNKCGIYEIRPVDCSGFPHTHKKDPGFIGSYTVNRDFFWRCPIVYHVVDGIFEKVMADKKEVGR